MNASVRAWVAGAMLLGLPGVVWAQADRWERAVSQYLTQAEWRLREAGYTRCEPHLGVLNTDESALFTVTLERGVSYVLAGVCDPDCVELQLALFAPNGYEIDATRSAGSAPILRIHPREPTAYRNQVAMPRCTTNPAVSA
jgi:hypothetical protein